jgi:hypothetical protein
MPDGGSIAYFDDVNVRDAEKIASSGGPTATSSANR